MTFVNIKNELKHGKTCKFNLIKKLTKSSNHFRLLLPVYLDIEKLTFVDHNGFRRNL